MAYTFNLDNDYTVRVIWEGDIMTQDTYHTPDEAHAAHDEAVTVAESTTLERGIYGDTVVQIIDGAGDVLAETIVPGVDHR